MPFTFAHPGFTLPIKKWKPVYFSTTGLFFGSIAPDMDIILRLSNQRFHIFQYDLFCVVFYIFPIALLSSVYYHLVIRNILIDHLPAFFQTKFISYKNLNFLNYIKSDYLKLILSIFIGIYLHLFLDWISHWEAIPFKVYGGHMYHSMQMAMIFYHSAIYLPPLILSILGFYLIFNHSRIRIRDIFAFLPDILSTPSKLAFYGAFIFITLLITVIKTWITGIEKAFIADSLIINLTNGCIVSGVITPTLFFIRNKIKKVS